VDRRFEVIVIGGGHAGAEAAWAAANVLGEPGSVALVTMDPSKIGVMSCNPAIGGLAKGQLVREVDALNGLMGLATDATGIQFKMLNRSKGRAVFGPRAQCDKHAYAEEVQRLLSLRSEITVVAGTVDDLLVESGRVRGVVISTAEGTRRLDARAVVLTTGTFMRGLMHTGEQRTAGGRFGESAAVGISGALSRLGFELGRLKTGTPPRLRRGSIRWEELEDAPGDTEPVPFSDLTGLGDHAAIPRLFPLLPQVSCRQTRTTAASHDLIRSNLHRAPMYSGQIESAGPRYCPSIEDKVVRFSERDSHGVFLEPESLRDDWIYCNGISTSLPADVQDVIVRSMPGCEGAEIYRYGYAVEYDMVRPHQILATGMTKSVEGLFLAGQINGTSGYEEAAAQGLVAGLNAARLARGLPEVVFGRDEGYLGVMMDDLITKTPVEPYRMFTSRAEYRLLLRADNATERLGPRAESAGLLGGEIGSIRRGVAAERAKVGVELNRLIDSARVDNAPAERMIRRSEFDESRFSAWVRGLDSGLAARAERSRMLGTVYADRRYEPYVAQARAEVRRHAEMERRAIPTDLDPRRLTSLRTEAREALTRFRPRTFGQASRLEGITPADLTLLSVLVSKHRGDTGGAS
jgi:tRNA uridine 5-carboxymethylaminomethyl modification enzyme